MKFIIQLSFFLVILITGSESLASENLRLLGNEYRKFVSELPSECFKSCLYDKDCKASSYVYRTGNCFLFTNYKVGKESGWSSFFKNGIIPSATANNSKLVSINDKFSGGLISSIKCQTESECAQNCLNNNMCSASSFQISSQVCYLFGGYRESQEKGWISFFKPKQPLIKTNDPRFSGNTRLFNHYHNFDCLTQLECAQRCLNDEKCKATTFDLSLKKCYFYDKYEQKLEQGWTSFFRNGKRPSTIKDNSRYYQYYTIEKLETQSDCFAVCNEDKKCKAASYFLFGKQCYLHEATNEQDKEPGWISYVKEIVAQHRLNKS